MINVRKLAYLLAFFVLAVNVFSQPKAASLSSSGSSLASSRYFPVGELKEGMRGTARTVFRGSEPEEFNVEILGVIPGGIGPKQDLIVGRLSGGGADRTSVFAGMSGSPVYINGKLVGAISYSFPFSKEPICGITPIEQMISIFEQNPAARANTLDPPVYSFAELASTSWEEALPRSKPASAGILSGIGPNSALMQVAGQSFQRIATPVTFNGFSQEVLNVFAPQLMQAGLLPVAAVGGSAPITPMKAADENTLVGGDSVSMQLTRGDYSLAAAGTVTLRDGDKVYAFGHPFLSLGVSDLPMSESHVVTVIPNINNSFKLAVPDAMVGSMTQDRATGVFGKLGRAPRMIPVKINYETSRGQTDSVSFEIVKDDFLTPLLLNMTVYNTLLSQERSLGDMTVRVKARISLQGQVPVDLDRRITGGQATQLAAVSIAAPVSALLKSRFDDLDMSGITIDLQSTDGIKMATLERIALDRTEARPGDTVEIQAFARTAAGKVFVQAIPVKIPSDTPAGTFSVTVGDGAAVQQNAAIQQFVPRDLGELVKTINKLKLPDRLYTQIFRTTSGAIIGASEMPNLPPSVLATLNNDRTAGGIKPAVQTVISESQVDPAEFIISGQQTLSIRVVR